MSKKGEKVVEEEEEGQVPSIKPSDYEITWHGKSGYTLKCPVSSGFDNVEVHYGEKGPTYTFIRKPSKFREGKVDGDFGDGGGVSPRQRALLDRDSEASRQSVIADHYAGSDGVAKCLKDSQMPRVLRDEVDFMNKFRLLSRTKTRTRS